MMKREPEDMSKAMRADLPRSGNNIQPTRSRMLILSLGNNEAASAGRRLAFDNIPIYSSVYYMYELTTRFV